MRLAPRLVTALSPLVFGCGTPPAMAPSPVVPFAGAQVTPVSASAAPADSPPPPSLDRDFVHVVLPPSVWPLLSISGRGPSDVWILGAGNALLHLDGDRVVKTYTAEPCFQVAMFEWVAVSAGDELRLLGQYQDPGGRLLSAVFDPVKGVVGACGASSGFLGLDCPWHHAWGAPAGDGRLCTLGDVKMPDYDPFVPRDARVKLQIDSASARADDGWFVVRLGEEADERTEIHRYNGVTWVRVGALEKGLVLVATSFDKAGRGWILARRIEDDEAGPATALVRLDGRSLTRVSVPPSFEAGQVLASGSETVWFIGAERKLFEWDGETLREGESPFVPIDSWVSPRGDLWLLGEKPNELVHTTGQQVTR